MKVIKKKDQAMMDYLQSLSLADLNAFIDLCGLELDLQQEWKEETTEYWQQASELGLTEFRRRMNDIIPIPVKPLANGDKVFK